MAMGDGREAAEDFTRVLQMGFRDATVASCAHGHWHGVKQTTFTGARLSVHRGRKAIELSTMPVVEWCVVYGVQPGNRVRSIVSPSFSAATGCDGRAERSNTTASQTTKVSAVPVIPPGHRSLIPAGSTAVKQAQLPVCWFKLRGARPEKGVRTEEYQYTVQELIRRGHSARPRGGYVHTCFLGAAQQVCATSAGKSSRYLHLYRPGSCALNSPGWPEPHIWAAGNKAHVPPRTP